MMLVLFLKKIFMKFPHAPRVFAKLFLLAPMCLVLLSNCTVEEDIYIDRTIATTKAALISGLYSYEYTFPKDILFTFDNLFFMPRDFSNEVLTYSDVILNNSFVMSPSLYTEINYNDSIGAWIGSRIIPGQPYLEITDRIYTSFASLEENLIAFSAIDSIVSLFTLSDVSQRVMTIIPGEQPEVFSLRFQNRRIGIEIFALAENRAGNVQGLLSAIFGGDNSNIIYMENRTIGGGAERPVYLIREHRDNVVRTIYSGQNVRPNETTIFKSSHGIGNLLEAGIDSIHIFYLDSPDNVLRFFPHGSNSISLSDSLFALSLFSTTSEYSMVARYNVSLRNLIEFRYSWQLTHYEKDFFAGGRIYYDTLYNPSLTAFPNSFRLNYYRDETSRFRYTFFVNGGIISEERVQTGGATVYDSLFIQFTARDTSIFDAHQYIKLNENDSLNLFINVNRRRQGFSGIIIDRYGIETLFKGDSLNPVPI